jgi:hypothetical protein
MNPRRILLGMALAVAAGLAVFGDKGPATGVVEQAARRTAAAPAERAAARAHTASAVAVVLRLQPRETLIGNGKDAFNAGESDAFATRNWTPPPPPPAPAPPPPQPTAPPLPFTYIGKALEAGEWEVYLSQGERTWIVRNLDVIDGSYRVESIKPPLMTLTYLPLNQVQQLNIGVFD